MGSWALWVVRYRVDITIHGILSNVSGQVTQLMVKGLWSNTPSTCHHHNLHTMIKPTFNLPPPPQPPYNDQTNLPFSTTTTTSIQWSNQPSTFHHHHNLHTMIKRTFHLPPPPQPPYNDQTYLPLATTTTTFIQWSNVPLTCRLSKVPPFCSLSTCLDADFRRFAPSPPSNSCKAWFTAVSYCEQISMKTNSADLVSTCLMWWT